jgi:prophage regulatory protein
MFMPHDGTTSLQHFLRRPEVEQLTGLKRTRLYELIKAGEFPKPVRISDWAVAWIASEVAAWQAIRIASRDHKAEV